MKEYLKSKSDGETQVVPIDEYLVDPVLTDRVTTISAEATLDANDSDKTFVLSADEGAAITLPSPTSGVKYKFVVGAAFATTAWTIVADANVIEGGAIVDSTFVPASNENTITFAHAAEAVGDFVEIISDGTSWFVNGVGAGAGAITFTVA